MGTLVTDLSPVVLAQHGQVAFLPLVPSQMGWVLQAWERGGGGGQWVGGLRCRKRAGTTSCSGFKRKCLAASPISHPLLPSSLGGGSQLRARLLSLGGCQAALPAEIHPSAWFPWKRCSPHEILAWIFAPNPVPNPLGLTSQELFSSKKYRSLGDRPGHGILLLAGGSCVTAVVSPAVGWSGFGKPRHSHWKSPLPQLIFPGCRRGGYHQGQSQAFFPLWLVQC